MRRMGAILRRALAGAAVLAVAAGRIEAEPVKALDVPDCADVRHVLENGLPFGPGLRMLEFDLPKNQAGVEGKVCRLFTLGTGAHMETPDIRSLDDMRRLMKEALLAAGWAENETTARFVEKSSHGRTLFALARKNALCIAAVSVGMVEGVLPSDDAVKDGKVMLSALKPYQREWWISVDCFQP
jgi:hypothetical protein